MSGTKTSSFGVSAREGHDSSDFYGRSLYADRRGSAELSACDEDETPLPAELRDTLFVASSEDMCQLPDRCVHLAVTSPPYNVGKDYEEDLEMGEYLDFLRRVFAEVIRVLVPGGRFAVNVANLGRKPYIPLNACVSEMLIGMGFLMRGEIIWDKGASAGSSTAWGSWCSPANPVLRDTHEYILVFSKQDFARKVDRQKATISKDDFLDATKSVWRFPAESAQRVGHPAPFPVELPRRLIEVYSQSGDVVLDPFSGSGTTLVAAAQQGRHYLGYEVNAEYAAIARRRVGEVPASLFG